MWGRKEGWGLLQHEADGRVSLEMKEVFPEDAGKFSVIAKNALGHDVAQAQLHVLQGPPRPSLLSFSARIPYLKWGQKPVTDHPGHARCLILCRGGIC